MVSRRYSPDGIVCDDCDVSWSDMDTPCFFCGKPGRLGVLSEPWTAMTVARFTDDNAETFGRI